MRKIAVLVSDLGKVLLPFDTTRVWRALEPHLPVPIEAAREAIHRELRETGLGRGRVSGAEFHLRLQQATGLRMDYRQFALAWSDMFDEDQETQRLVARAPVRRRVLLSNTNEIHWEFLQERYAHVLAPFDDLVVSHEVGLEKPDPAIYHWVASRTGHSPEAHLFIDDIEENVIAAREAGWDGIHHTDAGRLYRELRRRGLAPE